MLYVQVGDSDTPEMCDDMAELATYLVSEGFDENFATRYGGIVDDESQLYASIFWGDKGKWCCNISEAELEELRHLIDQVEFDDITVLE